MANSNQIELVVTVEVDKANRSIRSINANLSGIESAAMKSARGASLAIDGMTASMVKGATAGNLLADGIKKAITWAKDWTIEAAKMAAHESRLAASGRALAKAHGITAEAFERSVEAVRKVGYHGEDAIHTIDRLIIADIELSKGVGLAKIAKDAAAIENIAAPEALEKILQAIEFGNARALRAAGLRVNFEREIDLQEAKLGRTLSENEKVQIRYNAVVQAAAAIQGAHAGAAGEAEQQMKALSREMHELREAVGAQFQDQFRWLVGTFRDLVKWLQGNTDLLVKFGEAALYVAGVLTTYALATKIMALAKSVAMLNLASLNPYAVLASGVVAAGAVVYSRWKDTNEELEGRFEERERASLRREMLSGGGKLDDLRKRGYTDERLREILSGRRALPGEGFEVAGPKVPGEAPGPNPDDLKLAAEIRKKQAEAERTLREAALSAGTKGALGFAKDVAEMNAQLEKLPTYVDDKGKEHRIGLTRDAWVHVIDQLERRWGAFKRNLAGENHKHLAEVAKAEQEAHQQRMERDRELLVARLQHEREGLQQAMQQSLQIEEQRAGITRDARLRDLESFDARTLDDKVQVEDRKAEIEIEHLERVHEIRQRLFDLDTSRLVIEEEANLRRIGYNAGEIRQKIAELTQQREELRQANQEGTDAAVDAARETAAHRSTALIRDHTERVFDSIKRQAEGVFDALLSKSQSVWSAIANSFKTAILTAMKEVITSEIAALFTRLITGRPARLQTWTDRGFTAMGVLSWLGGRGAPSRAEEVLADRYPAFADPFRAMAATAESDPVRVSLLRHLERRTRAQAEYERIVAADSPGLVDVGTGLAASLALLHPVGNVAVKGLTLLNDPSWKQFQSVIESFSPTEGGSGPVSTAVLPLHRLKSVPKGRLAAPQFGTVAEAEAWMHSVLDVKRASLGSDLRLAQQVVEGFVDTVNRGGILPPRVAVDAKAFPLKEVDSVAHYDPAGSIIRINPLSLHWTGDTAAHQSRRFTERWSSTPNANSTFFHETGHYLHDVNTRNAQSSTQEFVRHRNEWPMSTWRETAQTVSAYAAKSPKEFVAEVYAGKLDGRVYAREVERLYRDLGGPEIRMARPGTRAAGASTTFDLAPLPDRNPFTSEDPFAAIAGAAETDPIRTALLQNLEKRSRAQAEYDRILEEDAQGLVDVGTGLTATIGILHPLGNLLAKSLTVLSDPTWQTIQSTLNSLSPLEGGSGVAAAAAPGGVLSRRGNVVNPESIEFLFNKKYEDLAAIGRKGGLTRVRNQRLKALERQWERELAREDAAAVRKEQIEYTTSKYQGPEIKSTETTREAISKLDALFPHLAGAEKTRQPRPMPKPKPLPDMYPWWPRWTSLPGAPGGTSGFAGPVSLGEAPGYASPANALAWQHAAGTVDVGLGGMMRGGYYYGSDGLLHRALGIPGGAAGATRAGIFSKAAWAGTLDNLKDFAGIGGSVETGAGAATTWQAGTFGQKLSSIGKSNAALLGGALLAMDGIRRGGLSGTLEAASGGALIGFKFGGPLGAAIGAAVGAGAGLIRTLFFKGAAEKVREKIKGRYQIDLTDKGILRQIVQMAKQSYGGNLDVAIGSPPVRELIELYALQTGQRVPSAFLASQVRAATLVQTGGHLAQQAAYSNGRALAFEGGLGVYGGVEAERIGTALPYEFRTGNLPKFAEGGIVPGRKDLPTLAMVHDGEAIIPNDRPIPRNVLERIYQRVPLPMIEVPAAPAPAQQGSQTTIVPVYVDGEKRAEVMIRDGRVIAQAAVKGMRASAGRFDWAAATLSLGLVRG